MIRVGVRVARERAELVAAELLVLSPGGLEELEHLIREPRPPKSAG